MPIPGTKRAKYLDDNLGALNVHLTPEELAQIDAILPVGRARARVPRPGDEGD